MILRALAIAVTTAALTSACACHEEWAYFPNTLPYTLPDVMPGVHLTESQALELAVYVAVYHRRNPANYGPPRASFKDGEWYVSFDPISPPTPAFGSDFAVYIFERDNTFSLSPGR
jgi:hypothetical protein